EAAHVGEHAAADTGAAGSPEPGRRVLVDRGGDARVLQRHGRAEAGDAGAHDDDLGLALRAGPAGQEGGAGHGGGEAAEELPTREATLGAFFARLADSMQG